MSGKIDENVDPVLDDLAMQVLIIAVGGVTPGIRRRTDPLRHCVTTDHIRITCDVEAHTVVGSYYRFRKGCHRMTIKSGDT